MVKISVIVPTYNSNEDNLNRIMESFNKQTMAQKDYEVIFVDDGSDDFQSYRRLKEAISGHNNYFAYRVSPSGWASRPRNKGTKMARGEYVFFSDDDDTIFPQALERMYTFAKTNDLDVVNPKVVRTKGWSWGWEEFKENIVGAESKGIQSMGPMTVPKLYKKSFIEENNLYFSEGDRVWWEDVMFSCLVYTKKPKIGILADYPIYHWREQNRSAGFGKDLDYKWSQLNNLAEFFSSVLNEEDRETMITHWYKSRILGAVGNNFHKKKETTQEIEFKNARMWKEKYVNENVINSLDTNRKILDNILAMNKMDLAVSLSEEKAGITARSYLTEIYFEEDAVVIASNAELSNDNEDKVRIKGRPDNPKINLPADVKKSLPSDLHTYGDADSHDNMYLPALKGRFTRTTWDIKDVIESSFNHNKSLLGFSVTGKLKFKLKLDSYIQDDEDKYQPWDIATRFSYLDNFSQRAIACKENFKKAAIINGNTYVVYKNNSELLSIDLNSTIMNFLSVAKLSVEEASAANKKIIVPIVNTYVHGESAVSYLGSLYNESTEEFIETNVRIITSDAGAFLEVDNPHDLQGECTIDVSLGMKSHRFNIKL